MRLRSKIAHSLVGRDSWHSGALKFLTAQPHRSHPICYTCLQPPAPSTHDNTPHTQNFLAKLWDNLAAGQIHFTLHWGKFNFWLNKARVESMYGTDLVQKSKDARKTLLEDDAVCAVFTNKFTEDAGLAD